jgi:type IV pilus assembly protein PilQ
MTRKFVHLTLIIFSLFLMSCSLFSSGDSQNADEIENTATNMDDSFDGDTATAGSDEAVDDLDVETADTSAGDSSADTTASNNDSFSDIEDFNEGLIENELSDDDLSGSKNKATETAAASDDNFSDEDFDVETADTEEAPAAQSVVVAPAPAPTTGSSTVMSADNKITNLEYKSFDSGGTVVISADKPFVYQVREEPQYNQTIIEVADVELPERFKLPYIAKDFGQAVATVNAYQESGSTTARFVIQYKSKMKPTIQQRQNSLLVMNSSRPGTGSGSFVSDASFEATATPSSGSYANSESTSSGKSVAGKKITIEYYGVDIKQVIQMIADDVGVNFIIDDDVSGPVNVKLRNVEWEEGLSSILNANGLGYERKGQILRIAKVATITKEINDAQSRIKAEAAADLVTLPKIMKIIPINYGDLDSFVSQIKPLLSPGENVTVDKRSNSLVVTGFPDSIKRAEQIVKSLDIQPLQVMIEGKIIEASNEFSKEFGIQWTSKTTFNVGSGGSLSSTIKGDANPNAALGGFIGDIKVGALDVLGDLGALLSIFEREQKIKILSSPKVMALNKETAIIKQSTQIPIFSSTVVANVGATNSVTFQDAILSLQVTPAISFNSDMILDIKVNRDIPGAATTGGSIQLNKREASTKILVKDGQSAVLGGIFSMDERQVEVGVPWLKDIPVLGYLFKSKRTEMTKNELVIFLSPKILNPRNNLTTIDVGRNNDTSFGGESVAPSDSDKSLENEIESL